MCLTLCYTQSKFSDGEKIAREFIRKTAEASRRDGPILASHLLLIASLSLCPSSSVAPFLCSPSLCSSESSSPLPVFFHSSWWDVRWDVCIFLPFGSRKMKKKKNANSANKSRFLCIWYPKTASYYIIQQIKMTKASKSSLYSVYHRITSSICRRRFGMHEVRVCE